VQYGSSVKARALYLHQYQLLPFARTTEAMADLFGLQMSVGTVARSVEECASQLLETELQIKRKLRRSGVLHADETGLRVTKKLHYIQVASTPHLTHYGYDARRGQSAIDEIGILPKYRGHLVHDGWWAYNQYTRCRHSLCGAHLLRELKFFTELSAEQKTWAEPLGALLVEIKAAVEGALMAEECSLATVRQSQFIARYEELLTVGMVINAEASEPRDSKDQKGAVATSGTAYEKQARNLLLRMERRREEVLCFMRDFSVPFDNNQAERDLRMVKLQQKIGGCFRSESGARNFCRIRSYISTMRKQGRGVLDVLHRACQGAPLSLRR
jgi:transposase